MARLARLRAAAAGPWPPRLLLALALLTLTFCALLRPSFLETRGDESTYVAMAESLVRDADLTFDERDLERARAAPAGPPALILQRAAAGVAFSKPVLYPLWCAPFVALFGSWWGMLVANGVALVAAFALARAALVARFGALAGEWVLATFAGAGALPAFAGWRMTEALQLALALAAVALTLLPTGEGRGLARAGAPLAGGLAAGLLVSLREPNALVAAALVAALWLGGRRRAAPRVALGAVAGYLLALALTWGLAGAPNPYKAPRSTFDATTGYPAGAAGAAAAARFERDEALATSSLDASPDAFDARRSAYAALYFLVGRHSGLLFYFPGVAVLLAAALARPRGPALAALGGVAALALFYLIWLPGNYFGGETFLANRYALAALPLALGALATPPRRWLLALAWMVAAAAGASALLSIVRVVPLDPTIHSHVHAGLFRQLPYESTASHLEGRRDRYWSGDFLRFVDPFALADEASFRLASPLPPAEVEVATSWPAERLRFVAATSGPRATLVVSDWRSRRRYEIPEGGGVVEIEPAPAWRLHPFWWSAEKLYRARLLRFDLESPEEVPVEARLRYLGRHEPPTGFAREVEGVALPQRATAGGSTLVSLRVVNRGDFAWSSGGVLPVRLGWRIEPVDGVGISLQGRWPLAREVPPGGRLETALRIDWPPLPGSYRLTLDLVVEDLAWFADRVGEPIAAGEVEVVTP